MVRAAGRARSRGFTYLALLFAVALLGLALSAAGTLWRTAARREREAELLWTGAQYRRAIESYWLKGPGGAHQLPRELEDLLEDPRGAATPARHLRRLYADPMTGSADWTLDRLADGSIYGVRSAAQGRPIKRAGFGEGLEMLEGAECYCDWAFDFVPRRLAGPNAPRGEAGDSP